MKKLLLAAICISTIFISCENELDIYAENEESMVVFGIINPLDTVHYIKVQKSFQEEGKEDEAALDTSNLYYGDNEISVFVDEYNVSLIKVDSFEFLPEWITDRDSGTFAHPNQKIYKLVTPNPAAALVAGKTYKLRVVRHDGDTDVTSETAISLSNKIVLLKPKFTASKPTKPIKLYDIKSEFNWLQNGGDIETFDFKFYYVEENINSGKRDTLSINYHLFEGTPIGDEKTIFLSSFEFLKRLSLKIEERDDVIRFPLNVKKVNGAIVGYPIEIDIWSAQNELSSYLNVNNSSSIGLVESNITYSNIENGFGLFSSRINYNLKFDEGVFSLFFDKRSLDSLSCSLHTRGLNFVRYSKDPQTTEIIFDDSPAKCN